LKCLKEKVKNRLFLIFGKPVDATDSLEHWNKTIHVLRGLSHLFKESSKKKEIMHISLFIT